MIQSLDERTPPMTPQLALRVAVVGTVALVLFAVIFFRLWFLQVLSGGQYAQAAQTNIEQKLPVAAPRGQILASNGTVLVRSEPVAAIQIKPPALPTPVTLLDVEANNITTPPKDVALYRKLAKVLRISTKPSACSYNVYFSGDVVIAYHSRLSPIACLVDTGVAASQYANVTIKTDVSPYVHAYLFERQSQFPGVLAQQVSLRQYPFGSLAAQVLGTVGQLSNTEENTKTFRGAQPGDVVGQSGLELEYNQYLMGKDGDDVVKVNAENQFEGYGKQQPPTPGDNLQTSLNVKLQEVGESALQQTIDKNYPANSGAFVAMDPVNGQIYAMGSLPSYKPSDFVPSLSTKVEKELDATSANEPLLNRAIDSPLPDGSTFKVITATAALETGLYSAGDVYDDTGEFCVPDSTFCLHNSDDAQYGPVDLEQAIEVSDDVYFYHLGDLLQFNPVKFPNGGPLQKWARAYGIGQTTGVDLPDEANGILPTPNYLNGLYDQEIECQNATGIYAYSNGHGEVSAKPQPGYHRSRKHPASKGGCGIASPNESDDGWTVGDNIESGVGQGDDLVTPMQLAVVYAAIENGGTIVTPHIGEAIEAPGTDTVLQKIDPAPKRKLDLNPSYLEAIRTGLNLAAQGSSGTSADVMGSFPEPVYGKTGTAVLSTGVDDAWYVAYVPSKTKPIVVVVNVEKGGYGDVAAAPVAREILSQWFFGKPGAYTEGSSAGDQT